MPKEESEQDFDTKYFGAYKNLSKLGRESEDTGDGKEQREYVEETSSKKDSAKSIKLPSSLKRQKSSGTVKSENVKVKSEVETRTRVSKGSVDFEVLDTSTSQELLRPSFHKEQRESVR